jgi:hypothetical protein
VKCRQNIANALIVPITAPKANARQFAFRPNRKSFAETVSAAHGINALRFTPQLISLFFINEACFFLDPIRVQRQHETKGL